MVNTPKVLVGCPVSDYHTCCTPEYIAALQKLTYSDYNILLADNSATNAFYQTLVKRNIPTVRGCYEHTDVKKKIACSRNILRKKVLEKITFRIDERENTFDDPLFCEDALKLGCELWVDTVVKCKHLVKKRPWTWKELDKNM